MLLKHRKDSRIATTAIWQAAAAEDDETGQAQRILNRAGADNAEAPVPFAFDRDDTPAVLDALIAYGDQLESRRPFESLRPTSLRLASLIGEIALATKQDLIPINEAPVNDLSLS